MIRVNQDEIIRKTRKNHKVDCRHAGMNFYSDLDVFLKHNYEQYWESGNSDKMKIAFYEPDFKNLDNLIL